MSAVETIRCENLSKRFGKFVALDGLDLAIEEGAIFGFLGPNGASKTTTLSAIPRGERPLFLPFFAGLRVASNKLQGRRYKWYGG